MHNNFKRRLLNLHYLDNHRFVVISSSRPYRCRRDRHCHHRNYHHHHHDHHRRRRRHQHHHQHHTAYVYRL